VLVLGLVLVLDKTRYEGKQPDWVSPCFGSISMTCRVSWTQLDEHEDEHEHKHDYKAFALTVRFNYRSTVTTGDPG
jgi:hypothetical protein